MRIGIFGGSFDPVHIEHIRVAKATIDSLALDRLLIMPAFAPPHKPNKRLSPNADRLEMCRLAFADVEKAEVCDFEIARGGVSYTYLTCRHFRGLFPDAELFWLVGTDMLRDFPTWKNPENILSNVMLAVCARNEKEGWLERERTAFLERFGRDFAVVRYNGADVSSTKIRVLAAAGEPIGEYVGEKVERYIREKKLYEIPRAKEALALEKESRKAHSLRVAEVAAKRAVDLKIPERKAIAAALFHDCAKNLPKGTFSLPNEWGEVPESVRHQFEGAILAEREFGITDEDILNAVRYHTSGRENMSELEKLIFLADMVEEERVYEGVDEIRAAFWENKKGEGALDKCLRLALKGTVEYLQKKGASVYPLTLAALKYYENKENNG